ncbi:GGDEF domain-containing protein [Paenibacillus sacheonensis]|uniref:Diguanylate cyclase n=1 Tax=Paenibacillus sacheonensis TaxID=742054 RepID=A0A7X5C022_9BACL|nr:GGDEF domain-containing protein [Paenibacillus sacheonensis]MBM7563673.1 diguanylate cyclase (GGDEF)-like protein [Paenibacillus sacheonensis]NBC67969.1 diguanylate cyclase [Paenibacillus sacheonensis]
MTFIHWLAGLSGHIFASACVMTILVLMLFMAVKLYQSYRRNQTYLMLILVLLVVLIQNAAVLGIACSGRTTAPYWELASVFLDLLTFIIINFVFMKLYTGRSAKLKGFPFLLMFAGLALVTAAQVAFTPDIALASPDADAVNFLAVDFYGLILNFVILLNLRGIDQRFTYSASLIVYFTRQLSVMADHYVFHGKVPMLVILSHLLPVVYYALLFLLLFEWVLERLLMTFQSSITDGLTSLYNRRHFTKKADQLLRESKRIAIIFCDIDNFKKLNDTQGHHKADGVLKQVADILREETAGIGTAGRYGGEELLGLIAAPGIKPEIVAEAIRSRVEKETIVTISVGVSAARDGASVAEIVRQADEAMYQSKTTGKNKVTLHASMRTRSRASDSPAKQNAQM